MAEAQPGDSAADVIRRKCRTMVAYAKKHGWAGPPFDPITLAGIHRIKVEAVDEEFDGEGRIFPRRGRVVIQYKRGSTPERQRFTICHEIAHTCFPDAYEFVRHHDASDEGEAHRKFENLCDIGAGELLMPFEDFDADLLGTVACIGSAQALARRYAASIDATIKRMLDLTSHSCAVAFLTDRPFRNFDAISGRMRVKYCWRSKNFRGYLSPGTLSPLHSSVCDAPIAASPTFVALRETWWINSQPRTWYVESLRLPEVPGNDEYPKVLAFMHSRKPAA